MMVPASPNEDNGEADEEDYDDCTSDDDDDGTSDDAGENESFSDTMSGHHSLSQQCQAAHQLASSEVGSFSWDLLLSDEQKYRDRRCQLGIVHSMQGRPPVGEAIFENVVQARAHAPGSLWCVETHEPVSDSDSRIFRPSNDALGKTLGPRTFILPVKDLTPANDTPKFGDISGLRFGSIVKSENDLKWYRAVPGRQICQRYRGVDRMRGGLGAQAQSWRRDYFVVDPKTRQGPVLKLRNLEDEYALLDAMISNFVSWVALEPTSMADARCTSVRQVLLAIGAMDTQIERMWLLLFFHGRAVDPVGYQKRHDRRSRKTSAARGARLRTLREKVAFLEANDAPTDRVAEARAALQANEQSTDCFNYFDSSWRSLVKPKKGIESRRSKRNITIADVLPSGGFSRSEMDRRSGLLHLSGSHDQQDYDDRTYTFEDNHAHASGGGIFAFLDHSTVNATSDRHLYRRMLAEALEGVRSATARAHAGELGVYVNSKTHLPCNTGNDRLDNKIQPLPPWLRRHADPVMCLRYTPIFAVSGVQVGDPVVVHQCLCNYVSSARTFCELFNPTKENGASRGPIARQLDKLRQVSMEGKIDGFVPSLSTGKDGMDSTHGPDGELLPPLPPYTVSLSVHSESYEEADGYIGHSPYAFLTRGPNDPRERWANLKLERAGSDAKGHPLRWAVVETNTLQGDDIAWDFRSERERMESLIFLQQQLVEFEENTDTASKCHAEKLREQIASLEAVARHDRALRTADYLLVNMACILKVQTAICNDPNSTVSDIVERIVMRPAFLVGKLLVEKIQITVGRNLDFDRVEAATNHINQIIRDECPYKAMNMHAYSILEPLLACAYTEDRQELMHEKWMQILETIRLKQGERCNFTRDTASGFLKWLANHNSFWSTVQRRQQLLTALGCRRAKAGSKGGWNEQLNRNNAQLRQATDMSIRDTSACKVQRIGSINSISCDTTASSSVAATGTSKRKVDTLGTGDGGQKATPSSPSANRANTALAKRKREATFRLVMKHMHNRPEMRDWVAAYENAVCRERINSFVMPQEVGRILATPLRQLIIYVAHIFTKMLGGFELLTRREEKMHAGATGGPALAATQQARHEMLRGFTQNGVCGPALLHQRACVELRTFSRVEPVDMQDQQTCSSRLRCRAHRLDGLLRGRAVYRTDSGQLFRVDLYALFISGDDGRRAFALIATRLFHWWNQLQMQYKMWVLENEEDASREAMANEKQCSKAAVACTRRNLLDRTLSLIASEQHRFVAFWRALHYSTFHGVVSISQLDDLLARISNAPPETACVDGSDTDEDDYNEWVSLHPNHLRLVRDLRDGMKHVVAWQADVTNAILQSIKSQDEGTVAILHSAECFKEFIEEKIRGVPVYQPYVKILLPPTIMDAKSELDLGKLACLLQWYTTLSESQERLPASRSTLSVLSYGIDGNCALVEGLSYDSYFDTEAFEMLSGDVVRALRTFSKERGRAPRPPVAAFDKADFPFYHQFMKDALAHPDEVEITELTHYQMTENNTATTYCNGRMQFSIMQLDAFQNSLRTRWLDATCGFFGGHTQRFTDHHAFCSLSRSRQTLPAWWIHHQAVLLLKDGSPDTGGVSVTYTISQPLYTIEKRVESLDDPDATLPGYDQIAEDDDNGYAEDSDDEPTKEASETWPITAQRHDWCPQQRVGGKGRTLSLEELDTYKHQSYRLDYHLGPLVLHPRSMLHGFSGVQFGFMDDDLKGTVLDVEGTLARLPASYRSLPTEKSLDVVYPPLSDPRILALQNLEQSEVQKTKERAAKRLKDEIKAQLETGKASSLSKDSKKQLREGLAINGHSPIPAPCALRDAPWEQLPRELRLMLAACDKYKTAFAMQAATLQWNGVLKEWVGLPNGYLQTNPSGKTVTLPRALARPDKDLMYLLPNVIRPYYVRGQKQKHSLNSDPYYIRLRDSKDSWDLCLPRLWDGACSTWTRVPDSSFEMTGYEYVVPPVLLVKFLSACEHAPSKIRFTLTEMESHSDDFDYLLSRKHSCFLTSINQLCFISELPDLFVTGGQPSIRVSLTENGRHFFSGRDVEEVNSTEQLAYPLGKRKSCEELNEGRGKQWHRQEHDKGDEQGDEQEEDESEEEEDEWGRGGF